MTIDSMQIRSQAGVSDSVRVVLESRVHTSLRTANETSFGCVLSFLRIVSQKNGRVKVSSSLGEKTVHVQSEKSLSG